MRGLQRSASCHQSQNHNIKISKSIIPCGVTESDTLKVNLARYLRNFDVLITTIYL